MKLGCLITILTLVMVAVAGCERNTMQAPGTSASVPATPVTPTQPAASAAPATQQQAGQMQTQVPATTVPARTPTLNNKDFRDAPVGEHPSEFSDGADFLAATMFRLAVNPDVDLGTFQSAWPVIKVPRGRVLTDNDVFKELMEGIKSAGPEAKFRFVVSETPADPLTGERVGGTNPETGIWRKLYLGFDTPHNRIEGIQGDQEIVFVKIRWIDGRWWIVEAHANPTPGYEAVIS